MINLLLWNGNWIKKESLLKHIKRACPYLCLTEALIKCFCVFIQRFAEGNQSKAIKERKSKRARIFFLHAQLTLTKAFKQRIITINFMINMQFREPAYESLVERDSLLPHVCMHAEYVNKIRRIHTCYGLCLLCCQKNCTMNVLLRKKSNEKGFTR